MYKIYILEDEENFNHLIKTYLTNEGYQVKSFYNGQAAIDHIAEEPHLWILDIMLPDIDGFEVLKKIKNHNSSTPVIFMSARDSEVDRVLGLESGSDDYITKPFFPKELVIRVNRLIKLIYNIGEDNTIKYKQYSINTEKRTIYHGEEELVLTTKEFDLLLLFIKNENRALSRDEIMNEVWGKEYYGVDRSVDDLVKRLRKKIPDINIKTIYGFGYRLI
jgi:two-component system response regulator CssR